MLRYGSVLGYIHAHIRHYSSFEYIVSAIPPCDDFKAARETPSKGQTLKHGTKPPKRISDVIVTSQKLNDIFRPRENAPLTTQNIQQAQSFFNRSKITLEWTLADYSLIPDVKYQRLFQERKAQMDSCQGKTLLGQSVIKSSFGIHPKLLKPLPEVLILGHTNAGKSSLINTLLHNKMIRSSSVRDKEMAYVSKHAGFTKTLNCYSIDNMLRLIDSPGYGCKGQTEQGEAVLEYIKRRSQFRRAFVIIDSVERFREQDLSLINFLIENGTAFEIIFTKVDMIISKFMPKKAVYDSYAKQTNQERIETIKLFERGNECVVQFYRGLIASVRLDDLVTVPRILFNNSSTNRYIYSLGGLKEIRAMIAQSCSLLKESHQALPDIPQSQEAIREMRRRQITRLDFVSCASTKPVAT